MTLPFFHKTGVKKKKELNHIISTATNNTSSLIKDTSYPTLSSLIQKNNNNSSSISSTSANSLTSEQQQQQQQQQEVLEPEDVDENFFYKHITTHFHSLFCNSAIICIPHSRSIEGLVLTKDIIETHCFQPSPYFCGQFMATKQKQKIISLDFPIITTIRGFKEERTVNIMAEETVYLKTKKIRLLSIDRLLEGEAPQFNNHNQKHAITIPPVRNSRTDLEFLNMFPENLEALYELQIAVQEFTDTYVYIKGYNRCTVERIQHMYMKTYRTILQRNKLLQDSCRTPSEHDQFLELVENVVMSFLHKKIWIQSLHSLLSSQDNYLDTVCFAYANVTLSQYSLRYPISEMHVSCFSEAIQHFKRLDSDHTNITEPYKISSSKHQLMAFTPLEKLAVVKATLDLISNAVSNYIQDFGNGISDTSVTADEMIPLLAFVIVQSNVARIASTIYYMQYYRLARMVEGSVYSFVVTTMKTACEFLKDDPLSLNDSSSVNSNLSATSSSTTSTVTERGERVGTSGALSPHLHHQSLRSRSTSFGSSNLNSHNSSNNNTKKPNSAPPPYNSPQQQQQRLSFSHRKSQSADLYGMIDLSLNSGTGLDQQVFSDSELMNNINDIDQQDLLLLEDEYGLTTTSGNSSLDSSRRNSAILRPHIVLPNPRSSSNNSPSNHIQHESNRKSLDIPNDWLLPATSSSSSTNTSSSAAATAYNSTNSRYKMIPSRNLGLSRPMVSTTFPSISNSTPLPIDLVEPTTSSSSSSSSSDIPKLGRSLSASTVVKNRLHNKQQPPKVINLRHDRISAFHHHDGNKRPASICIDTRSLHSIEDGGEEESEELMGDFLRGLSKLDGNVVGERTGSFKTFRRL